MPNNTPTFPAAASAKAFGSFLPSFLRPIVRYGGFGALFIAIMAILIFIVDFVFFACSSWDLHLVQRFIIHLARVSLSFFANCPSKFFHAAQVMIAKAESFIMLAAHAVAPNPNCLLASAHDNLAFAGASLLSNAMATRDMCASFVSGVERFGSDLPFDFGFVTAAKALFTYDFWCSWPVAILFAVWLVLVAVIVTLASTQPWAVHFVGEWLLRIPVVEAAHQKHAASAVEAYKKRFVVAHEKYVHNLVKAHDKHVASLTDKHKKRATSVADKHKKQLADLVASHEVETNAWAAHHNRMLLLKCKDKADAHVQGALAKLQAQEHARVKSTMEAQLAAANREAERHRLAYVRVRDTFSQTLQQWASLRDEFECVRKESNASMACDRRTCHEHAKALDRAHDSHGDAVAELVWELKAALGLPRSQPHPALCKLATNGRFGASTAPRLPTPDGLWGGRPTVKKLVPAGATRAALRPVARSAPRRR